MDDMGACIGHAVLIATNLNQKTLKLSTLAIESLTEILSITHITRRRNALVFLTTGGHCDWRRNEKYRKVFSLMISEIFGLVARLSESTQSRGANQYILILSTSIYIFETVFFNIDIEIFNFQVS